MTVTRPDPCRELLLIGTLLGSDIFKPRQGLHATHPEPKGYFLLQVGGHETLDHDGLVAIGLGQNPLLKEALQAIPDHEGADLIAGEQFQLPFGIPGGHSHAVIVGIGCLHKVGLLHIGQGHSETQCLGILGIG